jgi:hypothetical protein
VRRRDPTKITVGVALGASIAIAVAWFVLRRGPAREPTIAESARSARVVRHDAMGLAVKDKAVRDPARVAAIVAALGVDGHAPAPCPADYGSAEVTIVLSGADVYARRSVHLFGVLADGGERAVLTVSSAGCRRGAPRDRDALVREIEAALE